MTENVIELNGKRYDAVTGAYLGVSHTFAEPAVVVKPVIKGRVIDGFVRNKASHAKKPAGTHAIAVPKQPARRKAASHSEHKTAAHAQSHRPEHAKTLMRRAVQKPAASHTKPSIRVQSPAEASGAPLSAVLPKGSALQIDERRLRRAKAIGKHAGIKHFAPIKSEYTPVSPTAVPINQAQHVAVMPMPPTPAKRQHTDIFEAAMANAESHKQPMHKRAHRSHRHHIANVTACVAAFLIIGGFVTYLNFPNIELHVASARAGFKANIPSYKPTGYALRGGVRTIGNTVNLQFQSGENSYTLTQQPSNWNSQTLLESTTALSTGAYKTVDAAGRTIYIYKDKNAVWVNNGVRYDLNSNTSLSSSDIADIAASL